MLSQYSVMSRAQFVADELNHTSIDKKNVKIYVSKYFDINKNLKFSVRLNEIGNRINELDTTMLFHVVNALSNRIYNSTSGGLMISTENKNIFWPRISNISLYYQRFCRLKKNERTDLATCVLMSACDKWSDDIREKADL
jgi:hypothetical protein